MSLGFTMKGHHHHHSLPPSPPPKRRCTALAAAVPALVVCSILLPLVFLLGLHRPGTRACLLASDLFCTLPTCCSPHLLLVFFFLTVSRAWIGGARRGCHQHCTISSTHFFPLLLNFIHATFRNYLFFSHSSDARVSF